MQASVLVLIEAVQAQQVGHAFGLSNGTARGEDGDDGASDFDVLCSPKRFKCQLWEIRAQADFSFPVGDHRLGVGFLRLR